LNYYAFTGPNPPYNAKADNIIDIQDIWIIADCLKYNQIGCEKRKMIGEGPVDIGDVVVTGQRVGQTFYHNW